MAFPTTPTNGQVTTKNGITYVYTSTTNSWTRTTALQGGVFNTLTANVGIFTGNTTSASLSSVNMLEKVSTVGGPIPGTILYECLTQSVMYAENDAISDFGIMFTGSSTTSLATLLNGGQSVSVVLIVKCGSTAYSLITTSVTVDGSPVTIKWQGGTAPTGNANSLDVYAFTIIYSPMSGFTVLGSQTKFA